jgi:hypothetical protein
MTPPLFAPYLKGLEVASERKNKEKHCDKLVLIFFTEYQKVSAFGEVQLRGDAKGGHVWTRG